MPEISRFFGIVIKMFFDDHNPPYFHAEYSGYLALIDIRNLSSFSGHLPPRVMGSLSSRQQSTQKSSSLTGRERALSRRCRRLPHLNSGQPTGHSSRSAQFRVVLSAELGRYQDFR